MHIEKELKTLSYFSVEGLSTSIITEGLSPSTEKYDKGFKLFFYMQIPSLKEYIMISSTGIYIHISRKQSDSSWKFEEIINPDDPVLINTIEHNISIQDIYDQVKF